MKPYPFTRSHKPWMVIFLSLFVLGLMPSCNAVNLLNPKNQTTENYPEAEVIFQTVLPAPLPPNTILALEILDDVTGLAFNPTRYEMAQQDNLTYFVKLPLVIGAVIKYRYVRQSETTAIEYTPQNDQVRFRLADITGPAIFQDIIAAWIDQPYSDPVGRVQGQFIDKTTNSPIPNLLVSAEGIQTVTASDGSFIMEGLTPGTHSLVVYSMDGQFKTFQQGVAILQEATTPVYVYLEKRDQALVTFEVSTPADFDATIPLRLASNMQSLGNVYADLDSGSTTIAANLPVLTKIKNGKYSLSLKLPVGFDLRYKFTLGDGLWNSELDENGSFVLRELIVPEQDATISDQITTFRSADLQPISFKITTPSTTPTDEIISIQFNPFGWFEPIPMVKNDSNEWSYTLYSPLNLLGTVSYRFCRNDLCESTASIATTEQIFAPSSQAQQFSIQIDQWSNLAVAPETDATSVVTDGGGLAPRPDFIAGFELTPNYIPAQNAYLENGFQKLSSEGANWIFLTPTWTATRTNPPLLEPLPATDINWSEMQTTILQAQQKGLKVALFPQINFLSDSSIFWSVARRDDGWWQNWFDRYHRYMMQIADLAALTGANAIVIGDPTVSPSMPGGILSDGASANTPANADEQWRQLVQDIRAKFTGTIIGAFSYPNSQLSVPTWLDTVDSIYVLYSPPLAQNSSATVNDLISIFSQNLEQDLYPRLYDFSKQIVIGINYPSTNNAFIGCMDNLGNCVNNWGSGQVDLDIQSRIYNAAIIATAKEPWLNGFVSRGYIPVASVADGSASINGKPAFDVLWFWYHFILNKTT